MHSYLLSKIIAVLLISSIILCFSETVISYNKTNLQTNIDNENIHNNLILKDYRINGKICYGYKVHPNPDLIISFDLSKFI